MNVFFAGNWSAEVSLVAGIVVLLTGLLTFLAAWVLVQALFPKFIREVQSAYDTPWKVTGVGLIGVGVVALLALGFLSIGGVGRYFAVALGVVGLAISLLGSAGLARRIGMGLLSPVDKDQPWRRTLRGGLVLCGTFLLPIFNFGTLLLAIVLGMGAVLLTIWQRYQSQRAESHSHDSSDED